MEITVDEKRLDRIADLVGDAVYKGNVAPLVEEAEGMRAMLHEFSQNAADDGDYRMATLCLFVADITAVLAMYAEMNASSATCAKGE